MKEYRLSERGKIVSYTVIRSAPAGFEKTVPYVLALIDLEDHAHVLSQVTDCAPEEVYIDMPVEATFRKLKETSKEGIIEYGFKFRPLLAT